MSEDRIGDLFRQYVEAEMGLIGPDYEKAHPPYSRSYQKRIKRLFQAEKYFGGNVRLYRIARRVAIFLLAFLSLFAAGEVSARVFGFNPWKYLTTYLSDSQMIQRNYTERNQEVEENVIPVPVSDIPTFVPEGYEKTEEDVGKESITVVWEKVDDKTNNSGIMYGRDKISENMGSTQDAEFNSSKIVQINGIEGTLYEKDNDYWLIWDDLDYSYLIAAMGTESPEITLIHMAESIYSEKK